MQTHRQTCQNCGSVDLRNIIAREPGQADLIYARCATCLRLVAVYELRDYYHHGKGVESFLRFHTNLAQESGRGVQGSFDAVKRRAEEGFERALHRLAEQDAEDNAGDSAEDSGQQTEGE
ncbi:MAG: hypothetical protein AAGK04_10920 [Planctomycetota bacterium]